MIEIAVCDDDDMFTKFIENSVLTTNNISCDVFSNGAALLQYLKTEPQAYHIYLLDIEMPEINGIDTALAVRKNDRNAVIIFITDYKEYVYDVLEVLPFRFLKKPVTKEQLSQVISDAVSHIRLSGKIFFFQMGHDKMQLHYHEIQYFEGAGRKVKIHTREKTYEYYDRISAVSLAVDASLFCRIHGSYLVNLEAIRCSISKSQVLLTDGTILPVSRNYNQFLRQSHLAFIDRRC